MAFDISLSAGMRSDLISLEGTAKLLNRTQGRLSSGKNVNSAVDDPAKFFAAADHTNHAGDLSARKSDMGEAIQAVKTANQGITSITTLINQARGLLQSRKAPTPLRARPSQPSSIPCATRSTSWRRTRATTERTSCRATR